MWESENRFLATICGGVLPLWAQSSVEIRSLEAVAVTITIRPKDKAK